MQSIRFSRTGCSLVRPACVYSNGCKSLTQPNSGKRIAKDKGVHYEMEVLAGGREWLVHSTDLVPVGTEVGIHVDPYDIQIMNKPESEDEQAVELSE